jgi:hypothetical protein
VSTEGGPRAVSRQLDEFELVLPADRPRQIGEEDDARLQRRYEQQSAGRIVAPDLLRQLPDAPEDLLIAEVEVADPWVGVR